MGCFDDVIRVRGLCDDTPSRSSIYLDDPEIGISVGEMEQMITPDYADVAEFVQRSTEAAFNRIASDVLIRMNKILKSTSLESGHTIGIPLINKPLVTGGNFRGMSLKLAENCRTSFLDIFISEISLFLNNTGTVNVLVYDTVQGKLLDTIPVDAIAGEIVSVNPYKIYKASRKPRHLFVGYDATGIDSYQTVVKTGTCCGVTPTCENRFVKAQGAQIISPFLDENITTLQDTAGLSLTYAVSCNHKDWVCSQAHSFAYPGAFATAASIMAFAKDVSFIAGRSNNMTLLGPESVQARLDRYEFRYRELLDAIFRTMKVPSDRICFTCQTPHNYSIASI